MLGAVVEVGVGKQGTSPGWKFTESTRMVAPRGPVLHTSHPCAGSPHPDESDNSHGKTLQGALLLPLSNSLSPHAWHFLPRMLYLWL